MNEINMLKNRELHVDFVVHGNVPVNEEIFPVKNDKFLVKETKFLVNNTKFPVVGLEIMKLMENKPDITIIELSRQLNISDRAVKNNIGKLKMQVLFLVLALINTAIRQS